jgi:hypothetical protein
MNTLKIPKSFDVCGKTYTVGYYQKPIIEKKGDKKTGWAGYADYNKQYIGISTKVASGDTRNQDDVYETYIHELIHVILDAADYHDIKQNEVFVNRFAKILHQALKTARY